MLDLYQTLQISENASMAEVRAAYKKRLSEVESFGLTKSEKKELIYKIKLAYELLGSDASRMEYDISWESNPVRQRPTQSVSYNRSPNPNYRKSEGYNKSEKGYSRNSSGSSLFSRLFQKNSFQWIFALTCIFGLVFISVYVVHLVKEHRREKLSKEKFQKEAIAKVQTEAFLINITENSGFEVNDIDSAFYGLSLIDISTYELKRDNVLRSIQKSNALELGLDSSQVHQFFNKWKNSHCYSYSRLNIATFYAPEVVMNNHDLTKEEIRLSKVERFKIYPYSVLSLSSTVKFEDMGDHKYSMKYIRYSNTGIWEITPGYIEFEVLPNKIQITREDIIYTE
ncbi:MAG: hypothetical protein R2809_00430 [Flavobacteriales bacterium]